MPQVFIPTPSPSTLAPILLGLSIVLSTPRPACSTPATTSAPRIEQRSLYFAPARKQVRHLVFLPSAYDPTDPLQQWPLIVGLHGSAGSPEQVMGFQRLTELAEKHGYVVVCPYSSGDSELAQRYVLRVVEESLSELRLDADRVFLLGISRGGGGVWKLATQHPDRWAGLAPISPATAASTAPLDRIRHLPTIVVIGDRDQAVSLRSVRRWVGRMAELDMKYRYVELTGSGHDLSRLNFLPLVFDFFNQAARTGSAFPNLRP